MISILNINTAEEVPKTCTNINIKLSASGQLSTVCIRKSRQDTYTLLKSTEILLGPGIGSSGLHMVLKQRPF